VILIEKLFKNKTYVKKKHDSFFKSQDYYINKVWLLLFFKLFFYSEMY